MLSLSGLGLSFVSLWFCSEAQGRPNGEEDSHCSNQDTKLVSLNLLRPGLVPHPLPMPHVFPMHFGTLPGRGQLALGLAFAENFGSILVPLLCLLGNTT